MTRLLNNRYQILEPIGEGGEYIVYLGLDTAQNKHIVIKRQKDSLQNTSTIDWQREAHLLEQIHLDSVVTCLDAFVSRIELVPYGYLIQEYVEGDSLDKEFLKKRYTQIEVKELILEVLKILIALQDLSPPIIHRDCKPANIIRRKSDQKLMLLDFGIAIDQTLDTMGHTMGVGSLGYQAPEQISGYPTLASDVYSTAVMAVEFLGRKSPRSMLRNQKLFWEESVLTVHPNWIKWLKKALQPEKERFQTAKEAWIALSQLDFHSPQNENAESKVEPQEKSNSESKHERNQQQKKNTFNRKFKDKYTGKQRRYEEADDDPFVEVIPESGTKVTAAGRNTALKRSLKKYRVWAIILLFFGGGFFSVAAFIYINVLLNKLKNDQIEEVAQVVDKLENLGCVPLGIIVAAFMGCGSSILGIFL